jgi:hypothetical protein
VKKLLVILGFCLLWSADSYSQWKNTNFTTSDYWKGQRKEFFFGIGATNFLGDLGGLNRVGTDYSFMDLEWSATRMSGHLGYRYRLRPWLATKSILQYGVFRGSDQLTQEPFRNNRNLDFKTHLIELAQHLEIIIFNNEEYGKRNKIHGLKGMKNKNTLVYIFSGICGFAYIPMAQDGTLLRPLKTEGQGLPDGPKPYGLFNWGIPFGLGTKIGIDQVWRLSFELTYTKTFTDYLDDVSTVYYDPVALEQNYGSQSAAYADRSDGAFAGWTFPGERRGDDKQKDAYFWFNVSLVKNLQQQRGKKIKWKYKARF